MLCLSYIDINEFGLYCSIDMFGKYKYVFFFVLSRINNYYDISRIDVGVKIYIKVNNWLVDGDFVF